MASYTQGNCYKCGTLFHSTGHGHAILQQTALNHF